MPGANRRRRQKAICWAGAISGRASPPCRRGPSGSSGISGTSGVDGSNGSSGINGTSGSDGSSGLNGTSGSSGKDGNGPSGSSGSSGVSGENGTSGTSGKDGEMGHAFDWQGSWDSTANYTVRDVVKFNNSVWLCLEDNVGNDPSQHPELWDMMIGSSEAAYVTTLKFSLSSTELSSLKSYPIVLFKPNSEMVIDLISAMLVFYPGKNAYSQSALGLYFGSEAAGGWESALSEAKEVKAWKATLFEGYEFPIGKPLTLRAEHDLGPGDGSAVLHVTFRSLDTRLSNK